MTIQRALEKLEIATETTFGYPGEAGAYTYLRTAEPVSRDGLSWKSIEDLHPRGGINHVPRILGPRTGTLGLKLQMCGWSHTLPVAAPVAASHPYAQILAWAMGYLESGGFAGPVATTGSTVDHVDAAVLTSFVVGQALAWNTQSFGYQVGWAKNNVVGGPDPTFDAITLLQTAAGVPYPVATATLYGALCAAMTSGHTNFSAGVREALRLRLSGGASDDQIICYGCMPQSLKLNLKVGEIPILDVPMHVSHWAEQGAGGAPADGTWDYPLPEALMGAWVSFGTSAATVYRVGDAEFDLGLEMVPTPAPSGASGICGYFPKMRRPRMTFTVYRSFAAEITDWAAQTGKTFVFTFGTQPGKMISIAFKNARIIEYPSLADENGLAVSKIVLEAQQYTDDTGSGSAESLIDKDCIIALI